jgi:hypothetical protein
VNLSSSEQTRREPTIRASTPEREKIINARIDKTDATNGRVTLTWDLLEQDDGFLIQLIFAGPSDTRCVASGVIEGQKHIAIFSTQRLSDWFVSRMLKATLGVAGVLLLLIPFSLLFPWGRSKEIPPSVVLCSSVYAFCNCCFLHDMRPGKDIYVVG